MSALQINHSPDLKRLRDEGYEIEVKGGYLITHHIPYVNSQGEIKYGKLISTLRLNNNVTRPPDTHVIHFMGEHPCHKNSSIMTGIQHAEPNQALFDGLIMNFSFSNKPPQGYPNYYEKITRYVEMISAPAKSLNPSVTAKTFRAMPEEGEETVFNYVDTNSSRALISAINNKLRNQRIGIIGLGGTGSYILDAIAKTTVAEIHLFDGDDFLQHNAFRSPGAPSIETLNSLPKKVDYFSSIYSNMHKGIKTYPVYVTDENINLLDGLSYVFVCIDSNAARGKIFSALKQRNIPFIDVGLGVNTAEDTLIGTLRVTVGTPEKADHLPRRVSFEETENNEYATNIQIAELNAFNALMAVIKWKQLSGVYQDLKEAYHITYCINTSQLRNEDRAA